MKPTKRMRANQLAAQLLGHITNSAIVVRNMLEDGDPASKISADDLKSALGEKTLLVIDKVLSLSIDDEDESERQRQRKARRDANAGRPPEQPPTAPTAETPPDQPPAKKRPRKR